MRSRLLLPQAVYLKVIARLAQEGLLMEEGQFIRTADHHSSLTPQLEQQAADYIQQLAREPYSPITDIPIDAELLNALIDLGRVVKVNESVIFASTAYQAMTERIIVHLRERGSITVAEARTMFDSSRKYMLPLLEYLDQRRITRRVGDERVLR
jgi:selenocysteine-specific elongation factor